MYRSMCLDGVTLMPLNIISQATCCRKPLPSVAAKLVPGEKVLVKLIRLPSRPLLSCNSTSRRQNDKGGPAAPAGNQCHKNRQVAVVPSHIVVSLDKYLRRIEGKNSKAVVPLPIIVPLDSLRRSRRNG